MMAISTPFQTLFAVPMTCESCVKDISESLHKLQGIFTVEANLKDQLVTIEGTAPPSAIVAAIQSTGRDAILRGSGGSNSAAVCILETHAEDVKDKVRGLARMVQVSPSLTVIDLTIRGLSPGLYWTTVRETGDISKGVVSTGGIWSDPAEGALKPRGIFGTITVGRDGIGSTFLDRPIQIWEMIGRSFVVSKQHESEGQFQKNDADTLVGVIARSAGIWDNDKTVCSCSGKTLWEERKDEIYKPNAWKTTSCGQYDICGKVLSFKTSVQHLGALMREYGFGAGSKEHTVVRGYCVGSLLHLGQFDFYCRLEENDETVKLFRCVWRPAGYALCAKMRRKTRRRGQWRSMSTFPAVPLWLEWFLFEMNNDIKGFSTSVCSFPPCSISSTSRCGVGVVEEDPETSFDSSEFGKCLGCGTNIKHKQHH